MGKKKFIDKKKSATFRLVFKDSSAHDGAGGPDRVFTRVDGGGVFVPGFSEDDPRDDSIFDDADDDEASDEEGEGSEPLHARQAQLKPRHGAAAIPEHSRRELVELGFPDDGYNYLQHLREIGPTGRSGAFVPNSSLRLDLVRADVKAYDASRVQVRSTEDAGNNDALLVSSSASRIRGPVSRVSDPEVTALLEVDDGSVFDSADELDDDFVVRANEGIGSSASVSPQVAGNVCSAAQQGFLDASGSSDNSEADAEANRDDERPARLLDEQFELLALREYDDDEIGELDDDDPSARGSVHISEFNKVMSDFLISSSVFQDKYQTPAEIQGKSEQHESESCLDVQENEGKTNIVGEHCIGPEDSVLFTNNKLSSLVACNTYSQSDASEEDKEVIFEVDSDKGDGRWDCETVVTTYSNLENHPVKIDAPARQQGKHRLSKVLEKAEADTSVIRLRGKQQLPVDFLPEKGRLSRVEKTQIINSSEDAQATNASRARRPAGETKEERKARKAGVKEEKRDARRAKKELKLLYKGESQRAQHGAAFTGPSTIHLS